MTLLRALAAVVVLARSVWSIRMTRWRFARRQRRPDDSAGRAATSAVVRLRHRLDRCTAAQDVQPALEHTALMEASAVLDEVLGGTSPADTAAARAVADLSLLHRIRAMGLGDPVEELHASVALQVLAYVIDPAAVAPQTYEEVTRAIASGAATDRSTARLRALQDTPPRCALPGCASPTPGWRTRSSTRSSDSSPLPAQRYRTGLPG